MTAACWVFHARGEADTDRLGQALAAVLPPGCLLAFEGTLGAGKTRLVQAIAAAAGVDRRDVVSPTFVLAQEYRGRLPIAHFDLYRLNDDDEFWGLGLDEYLAAEGWVCVEWSDRFARLLPAERLTIRITVAGETLRDFELSASTPREAEVIRQLAARVESAP